MTDRRRIGFSEKRDRFPLFFKQFNCNFEILEASSTPLHCIKPKPISEV